ncbi:MAG TPA: Flp family type IVb pilin [Planctomycetaceae bacterium]|nr:Flp family type IVb pilin [Planctomycetaceae bacterium]
MLPFLRNLLVDDSATTAVEYAVMLAMILMVLIGSVVFFGNAQNGSWGRIDSQLTGHGFGP